MRADRGRPGEPARPPDPDRHPGDGIRPQLATAGITPQDTRLTAPPAGRRGQPCSPAPGSSASSPTARACTRRARTWSAPAWPACRCSTERTTWTRWPASPLTSPTCQPAQPHRHRPRPRRLSGHPLAGQLHPRAGPRRARAGQPARRARHRRAPRHRARHPRHGPGQRALPARPAPPAHASDPPPAGRRPSHADARGPDHHDPAHGAARRGRARRGRVRRTSARRWLPAAPGAGEGKSTLASPTANHASCVGVSQPTTSAPTPPSHDFGYLRIRSLVLPVTSMLFSVVLMR